MHVPYKGGGPALTGVVAGEVQMTFDPVATSLQLIKSGKLRALAVAGPKRVAALPDVPTMVESGYQSFTVGAWTALLAPQAARRRRSSPSSTPRAQSQALAIREPMEGTLAKLGAEPRGGTPQRARRLHGGRERNEKWKPIIAALEV